MSLSSTYNSTLWGGGDQGQQGVCPSGWHVPSDGEWTKLTDTMLTGSSSAGAVLKSLSGWTNSGNGTDTSGFRALPGGYVNGGTSYNVGSYGSWWSAMEYDASYAWDRDMDYIYASVFRFYANKTNSFSLRCSKAP